jgi:outer membrane protein
VRSLITRSKAAGRVCGALLLLAVVVVPGRSAAQSADGPRGVLTLAEALERAYEANRELLDARQGLASARSLVREAWASVFPSVDASAVYTRNLTVPGTFLPRIFFDPAAGPDELVAVRFGADHAWNFVLHAEQPVFQAQAFIGVGAAERFRRWQQELVRGEAQRIATQVKLTYYGVLLAQEGARLTENSVARVRQVLEETRALNRAGLTGSYDVLRLEVELGNLEPELRRAQNQVAAAKRSLAVQLALETLDGLELEGSLGEPAGGELAATGVAGRPAPRLVSFPLPSTPPERDELLQEGLAERSDLRQLRLFRDLRVTELRLEQAEYLPRVALFANYVINAQQSGALDFFGESAAQRAYGRVVGVQVSVPLLGGGRRPARTSQRRAAVAQAELQLRLTEAMAENEIRTLLEQLAEAEQRAVAQERAVEQARLGHRIASVQYREGLGSQLQVTDAEVALRQSEFNRAEAAYDYLVAQVRLEGALGRVPARPAAGRIANEP